MQTESPTQDATDYPTSKDPTKNPTTTPTDDCVQRIEWTQERLDETCSGTNSHALDVGLCDTYLNPDYTTRLHFGLANNLYDSCSHPCVYDYKTYDADTHIAFYWTGSCYNLHIGAWRCIVDEVAVMNAAHLVAAEVCEIPEDEFECVPTVDWTPEVAEANCPNGFGGGGDKGYGTAKICHDNIRIGETGYFEYADVLYAESFNLTLANFVYWSCSATCMYDIQFMNSTNVVYNWKVGRGCWEMQTEWSCVTAHYNAYDWAIDFILTEACKVPIPEPEPWTCTERVTDWSEEIALLTCTYDDMGDTSKNGNASICDGYDDYQYRLDSSLANRMFTTCSAWCVYDIFTSANEAYIWRDPNQCFEPATTGLCIQHLVDHRQEMEDYVTDIFCESDTNEPTYAPTCQQQQEWSEELMDTHCSVDDTAATYKHYDGLGRAAVPCAGHEDAEDDLLKSMVMEIYRGCSSWCVYDYWTAAELAWKWNKNDLCWDLMDWGSCHWDYANGINNTEWEVAKEQVKGFCTMSPTMLPTGCVPYYTWNEDRADVVCSPDNDYGADKSYGVTVCSDSASAGKQAELEDSLANNFFTACESWCVYDYSTVINNVKDDAVVQGGFIWKSTCWQWVEAWTCFDASYYEFEEVMNYTKGACAAQV